MRPIQFSQRGHGEAVEWLRAHVNYSANSCLAWPFHRHPSGYGSFGVDRKIHYAHRFMCELVNGPPPSPKHQAAHSCGNGHMGCVNPKHLSWKTVRGNLLDRRKHGTVRANPNGHFGVLSVEDVAQIRKLGDYLTQYEIAKMFGVGRPAIQYWLKHDRPRSTLGMSQSAIYRRRAKARNAIATP